MRRGKHKAQITLDVIIDLLLAGFLWIFYPYLAFTPTLFNILDIDRIVFLVTLCPQPSQPSLFDVIVCLASMSWSGLLSLTPSV